MRAAIRLVTRFWQVVAIVAMLLAFVCLLALGSIFGRSSEIAAFVFALMLGLFAFAAFEYFVAIARNVADRAAFHQPKTYDFWLAVLVGFVAWFVTIAA